jgi:hypothetical protein
VNSPAPINEDETWRISRCNSNGITPYDTLKELVPIVEQLGNLQAGGILPNETNVELHKWEHRENAQYLFRNTFGGANAEYSTSIETFESRVKPGGHLSSGSR